jgi:transcriptional regulator with XRE-family HTH domain
MFWERLVQLCNERNTKPNPVAASLKISSGAVTKWKNGTVPNGSTLQLLADYFDVPVDYLLGKTDDPGKKEKPDAISDELWNKIENDPKALKLLELLLNMSPEQRDKFEKFLEEM